MTERKQEIYILSGLPGSGKSTIAKKYMDNNSNASRVNKDLIREMFHFGKWTGATEKFVIDYEYQTVRFLLSQGRDVVIDDTNLNPEHIRKYKEIAEAYGANVYESRVETRIDVCIARDKERQAKGQRFVGEEVIRNMAAKFGVKDYDNHCTIFDLDGTLCDLSHRQHHVAEAFDNHDKKIRPRWDKFFEESVNDLPRTEIIAKMHEHKAEGHDIVIVSACPEDYRDIREAWLKKHGAIWDRFIMRRRRDYDHDDYVKQNILDSCFDKSKIKHVYDDRPVVIRMWQKNGLNVHDVGDGKEF